MTVGFGSVLGIDEYGADAKRADLPTAAATSIRPVATPPSARCGWGAEEMALQESAGERICGVRAASTTVVGTSASIMVQHSGVPLLPTALPINVPRLGPCARLKPVALWWAAIKEFGRFWFLSGLGSIAEQGAGCPPAFGTLMWNANHLSLMSGL